MSSQPKILIIELGSQYALVIQRSLRELGYRSVVLEPKHAEQWIDTHPVDALILSGGQASVYDERAPRPPKNALRAENNSEKFAPVLGICYGMQYIAHFYQGEVRRVPLNAKYSHLNIKQLEEPDQSAGSLFFGTPMVQSVWASHGDEVVRVPDGFEVRARTKDMKTVEAIGNDKIRVYGVQFHPEVSQTEFGKKILENFVAGICGCKKDWEPMSVAEEIRQKILSELPSGKAIFGFSGGVDSTTLAALAAPVLGDRLLAVTVDCGNFRKGELREIRKHARAAGVAHRVINRRARCLKALEGITDAKEKRSRFPEVYGDALKEASIAFGGEEGPAVILQGTLAPDKIESGATGGGEIKRHHNVGIDFGIIRQLHPLDHLFKYEVRELAKELGLPPSVVYRKPFPGPGLFVRVVGVPVTPERLKAVRWADHQVQAIIKKRAPALWDEISQLVVAYLGIKTVGVKGDARAYLDAFGVRAIKTIDFMTAEGVAFAPELWKEIERVLVTHPLVNRAFPDSTDKPPATTEFE